MQCLLSNLDISYFEQVQGHNDDNHSAIETTFVCQFPLYCKYTSSINSSTSNLNLSRIILLYPYSFFLFLQKVLRMDPLSSICSHRVRCLSLSFYRKRMDISGREKKLQRFEKKSKLFGGW